MSVDQSDKFIKFFCEPAVILSVKGKVLALNSSACELLDAGAEDLIGTPLTALVYEPRSHIVRYLQSCASADQPVPGLFSWRCLRQGQRMLCHGQAFTPRRILLRCATELTRQERAIHRLRERLEQFNRLSILNEMASGITHELNQSLTGIAIYARGCRRQLESGRAEVPEILDILDKISDQARQSGFFLHGLCKPVNTPGGKRELCDLNTLVRESLRLANTDAGLHGVPIDAVLTESRLPVMAVPIQIQQILVHLLCNAIEASAEFNANSATVLVSTTVAGRGFAKVVVTDRGTGLAIEAREKLFEPFFTTKPLGLGMGLAVCRTLVIAHGGRIGFSDNAEGGTTLYFTLPLAESEASDD